MLELHTMVPGFGFPTFTPFGLKVIAYLRLAAIPHRIVIEHNPMRGPKGKFPWIVDGDKVVPDSGFIIDYVAQRYHVNLDERLTQRERASAHALRRMVEESLCFNILYYRWTDDDTYLSSTRVALSGMPPAIRTLLRPLIRKRMLRDLRGQGVLRHSPEEVALLGCADLEALAMHLGHQDFMMGDQPTSLDATAIAFLAVILAPPFDNPLKRCALSHANLIAYAERMSRRCFDVTLDARG